MLRQNMLVSAGIKIGNKIGIIKNLRFSNHFFIFKFLQIDLTMIDLFRVVLN